MDSVYLGERVYREYIARPDRSTIYFPIPFDASEITAVHPSGGFWHANTASYRLTRTGEEGDTVAVIEAGLAGLPVIDDDRNAFVQEVRERLSDERPVVVAAAEAAASLAPDFKPILEGFFVDEMDVQYVVRAPLS